MSTLKYKLNSKDIDYSIPESSLPQLDEREWASQIIGQSRAVEAIELGTAIRTKGYNIFVTGAPGTGRRTAVMNILSSYKAPKLNLHDAVYVYNFTYPQQPIALYFKAGEAQVFKKQIHNFIENIKKLVSLYNTSADTKNHRDEIESKYNDQENEKLSEFEAELTKNNFKVVHLQNDDGETSTDLNAIIDKQVLSFDEILEKNLLSEDDFFALREKYYSYMDKMRELFIELRKGREELGRKIEKQKVDTLSPLIQKEIDDIAKTFDYEKCISWLCSLKKDVIDRLYLFEENKETKKSKLARYGVNILCDNSNAKNLPVIFEANPTYSNIFGGLDSPSSQREESRSIYLNIRAGSLIKSAGGFLVLQAEDLVKDEVAWAALKCALKSGKVEIQAQMSPMGVVTSMKPEALELDLKVVLIGGEMTYDAIFNADPDFEKLFKVCAEFDSSMKIVKESISEYVAFVRKITLEEGLLEPSNDGLTALIEFGIKLAGRNNRLSTRFSKIADLIREADYYCLKQNKDKIDGESVRLAEKKRRWFAAMPEEKIHEMIVAGDIILETQGSRIGRLNGLAVFDRGYYAFGIPAVISAQVSPGESGVVNIEGESGLSGEIYDKAVLIVEGFLRSRFAHDFPLSVTASICFEQSYNSVEGDSASSTAVYALLSAIAEIPLRQDIAVTGSMNQMGQVQAVGGVTEKVEGYYKICKETGLTGTQGVMIPKQNIPNLLLSKEILEAIKDGKFSIYAVSSIDEGLEVLSSVDPGKKDKDGEYPEKSFNGIVLERLRQMAETLKTFRD